MIYSISSLNGKIDSINKSLEIESEDHYINIQKNIGQSVVMVLSSPAHSDSASNDVIYLDNKGQAWNMGTGFSFNNEGNILTANHVIKNATAVVVVYQTTKIPVTKSKNIPELDLAILYVNSSISPVRLQGGDLSDMNNRLGSSVAFIGYPLTTPIQTTVRGSVSGLIPFTYENEIVPVYVLGAAANKGNSGGPVFSLKTGEVIGIINEKIEGTEGIAISTAINQNLINNIMNS